MIEFETVVDGLVFPECPRWRTDTLWFVDIMAESVLRLDPDGTVQPVATVPGWPAGLGFTADGAVLVVSMQDRRLCKVVDGALVLVADLSALSEHPCNDMVTDRNGRSYIGAMGVPLNEVSLARPSGSVIMVEPDGSSRIVAGELVTPNGCVLSADGSTFVIVEAYGERLSAFDVAPDGSLSARRVFSEVGCHIDGICMDEEGSIWAGSPRTNTLLRVDPDGQVAERLETERSVIACALGGADGRTLYCCTVDSMHNPDRMGARAGRIESLRVDVPGAEMP
jgi:sugar lactone lactonase YvrE